MSTKSSMLSLSARAAHCRCLLARGGRGASVAFEMPLFDALEREVSSFFVAQGSVFDTILRTLLERISHVETRVDSHIHVLNELSSRIEGGSVAVEGGAGGDGNPELEYYVMTLARQLHIVLAMLFQPYTVDVMKTAHAKQQQMTSISDVLTENEAILMSCALQPTAFRETQPERSDATRSTADSQSNSTQSSGRESTGERNEEKQNDGGNNNVRDLQGEHPQTKGEAFGMQESQKKTTGDASVVPTVKSTFMMIHHLHHAEERRYQEEQELLKRMEMLLSESQAQFYPRHESSDRVLRELQHQNEKLREEWAYQQQQQASSGLLQTQWREEQQKELEKQLLGFTNNVLAAQTVQEQQITRILENLRVLGENYVSKSELEALAASWQQTARDDCIYGVNGDALTRLQHGLLELQQMLNGEAPSPVLSRLMGEITRVLELLEVLLKLVEGDEGALHGPKGVQMMQILRRLMDQLEELAHNALAEAQACQQSAAFITSFTRQMELGTGHLLETIEKQQESYQQALSQHQAELEQLKHDLRAQKMSDEELRKQLEGCPNQEDTLKLLEALKDQLNASTSDSTSRMLDNVEELRAKMAGLPTFHFLDELLHNKADKSEIDRLRLFLASMEPSGSGTPSIAKSPTRCLSCDQTLPYLQSRPNSASIQHHGQAARPASANAAIWSRPSSRASSPHRHSIHPSCPQHDEHQENQISQPQPDRNPYISPFTRAMLLVTEGRDVGGLGQPSLASTQEILRDLAATIEVSKRRRHRMESHFEDSDPSSNVVPPLNFARDSKRKTLGSVGMSDDRNNSIQLRRTTLSDQVVYGPSITTGFLKPKNSIAMPLRNSPDSGRRDANDSFKPKNGMKSSRRPGTSGGDVIVRAPSTTVVIRPFSELSSTENRDAPRTHRK